ncbi:MAG: family 78 glycoside hydrolase catalytic domain [Clostridia bacterium]|nr:family 78 glycoside hydrolase catalytic domain [Clostridia bacterium]
MLLQMTVRYTDGTTESFASDTTWQATVDGPITFNSIYYGETYDARKELGDWANVGYDASAWKESQKMNAPRGELICQLEDPIRRVASFEVKDIKKLSDGSYVIYAPEMISGWAKITFKNATAGDKITILYGEKILANGNVQKLGGSDGTNASWWPERYNMTDEYIAKGGESEIYEPKFSYKGYAYIQIWGYEGELKKEDIVLYRTANDVEVTGEFESSDQLINDLHAMMVRTMTNNLQGKPTDTPVWEKNGWLGDLNVALETFTYNFDFSNFLPNFVEIMEDCYEEYGLLPQMVPTANWGVADHYVWNSVFVFSVYELYNVYGMDYYMKEQYSVLKKYAQGIISSMRRTSWIAPDGQLGDWVSPMNSENAQYNESPNEGSGIVATAYVYKMLLTMAEIAELTGHTSDVNTYTSAAENIYEAFNEKFYNRSGYYQTTVWYNNGPQRTKFRQTSQLVPLAFGLVPEDKIQKVVDNLVNDIVEKNYHLDTGCVGAKEILPVLSSCGYADVAYKILTQRTYPSWGFMIEEGATSLWEMWETTTRSRAHYFLGTYDEWLFQYLAGITNVEQGYAKFTINPYIPDELTYITCTENTVRGKIESSWKKNDDGTVTMTITVPFGSEATVYFPTADAAKVKWNGTAIADTMDGIRSVGTDAGHAYAVLGSGSYVFVTANDAEFLSRTGAISVNVKTDLPAPKDPVKEEEIVHPTGTNLAKGKTATASSAANSPDYNWAITNLTNGDRKDENRDGEYAGYTSNSNTGANHAEWVMIDLGSAMTVNQVVCYASTPTPSVPNSCYCFAEDFEIQVSTDGTNWKTVYSEKDYKTPSWGPLTFEFDNVEARYVRFYASSLYPKATDGNRYYLQLCEMEVYKK